MAEKIIKVEDEKATIIVPDKDRHHVLDAIREILMTEVELHASNEADKRAWTALMAIIADWHNRTHDHFEMRLISGAYKIIPK